MLNRDSGKNLRIIPLLLPSFKKGNEMTGNKMPIKDSAKKALQTFKTAIPIIIGILLLINLLNTFLRDYYAKVFTGNVLIDPLIGSFAGSIAFGIPVTSYIVGGELLLEGVSLMAVTAFIMAWTTVGLAMLPLEITFLGKRFVIVRNTINFLFSIMISILVIYTLRLF